MKLHKAPWGRSLVIGITACLFAALPAVSAAAQSFERATETQANTAYFYYFLPGEATIQVSVWGTIPRPGIYEIQVGTNLEKLLTMAGGPPLETQDRSGRREVILRVYRPNGAQRDLLYEASLEDAMLAPGRYPDLADGDVFVVETIIHSRFNWRDAFTIVTTLSSLILVIDRVIAIGN